MIELNTRVIGRKTGPLMPSTVIAIFSPDNPYKLGSKYDFAKWYEFYPDWDKKNVYVCKYDEPIRPVTFDEYCNQLPLNLITETDSDSYIEFIHYLLENHRAANLYRRMKYDIDVKVVEYVSYPEEDLSIL